MPIAVQPEPAPVAVEPPVAVQPEPAPVAVEPPVAVQPEPVSQPQNPQPTTSKPGYNDPCAHGEGCNGGSSVDWSQADPTKEGSLTDPNPVTNKTMPWNW